jgi:hypothetical protein
MSKDPSSCCRGLFYWIWFYFESMLTCFGWFELTMVSKDPSSCCRVRFLSDLFVADLVCLLERAFFFSCCVLVQRLLEHGFVCVGPSGRFIRYPVDFISRPCCCRVWFLTDLFVVDLVCLARKSLFFLLCFNVRVVGTWICMCWQSIHAHYLILNVSRFVDVCRFQKFGSQVNVDWYLYQSLW